jgi:hypothetical protein
MSWLVCPGKCAKALPYATYLCREIRNLLHFLSDASKFELIACNNYTYIYLHCDVVEWLVQLTWGALTEKILRVLLVVIHWNSFDCPRLFRALYASTWCDLYASTWCNLGRSTMLTLLTSSTRNGYRTYLCQRHQECEGIS